MQAQWVEQRINPVGIDVKQARFTWTLIGDQANWQQTAYQIQVLKSNTNFDADKVDLSWDSGWMNSNQSHLIAYKGKPFNLAYLIIGESALNVKMEMYLPGVNLADG